MGISRTLGPALVCGLTLITIPSMASPQEPGPGDLEAYRAELQKLSRDGSWWLASNAAYAESDGGATADAYGTRFWLEPGGLSAGGCLWSIRDGKTAAVHWRFYQAWDIATGRAFFYQAHTSGKITGMGYLTGRDGQVTVLEQEFKSREGGTVQRTRHRNEWPDADTHVTYSADWSDGAWKPRRTYTWTRQTSGSVPCGPER